MTITKEGSLASFYTVNKAPIKHLRVYFSPKQAGMGDPSPENVRAISGHTSVNITQRGKNLFKFNEEDIISRGWNRYIPNHIKYAGKYSVSCQQQFGGTGAKGGALIFKNGNNNADPRIGDYFTGYHFGDDIYQVRNYTVTQEQADCSYLCLAMESTGSTFESIKSGNIQIELGEKVTKYEPFKENIYSLDWSNDIGTIYGGYVDLITGELVKTHNLIHYDGTENWEIKTSTNNPINSPYTARIYVSDGFRDGAHYSTVYSNKLKPEKNYYTQLYGVSLSYTSVFNIGTPSQVSDISSFRTWMNDIQGVDIIYPLQNPITHQLAPSQLQTLIGRNNIWSNADRVEVEYDLAESNDELYRRRNIILQGAPHLESASGTIAHFNTDLVAPIKSAKFYFEPIQSLGTPSPTNIKPITGYKKLNMHQFEKNLFNISTDTIGSKYINYSDGSIVTWGSSWNISNYLPIDANTQYTITCRNTGLANAGLAFYDSNQTYISGIKNSHSSAVNFNTTTFTTPINATYLRFTFVEPQIYPTILVKDTSVLLNSYTRDWSSEDTLYGGYIDLISGNLYQEWRKIKLADMTWANFSGKVIYYTTIGSSYDREVQSYIYSDTLTPITDGKLASAIVGGLLYYGIGTNYNNEYNRIWTKLPEAMESVDANAWIKETYPDATICYKLANPIYITTLTSQQLISFHNINNFQSEAKGQTEIQYWTH